MIIHNSAQSYGRPIVGGTIRQQLARLHRLELPGGMQLWKSSAKFSAVLLVAVTLCQLAMAQFGNSMNTAAEYTKSVQLELADAHIVLRAQRARLLMPENIARVAATELALQAPEPGQVSRYNKSKGRFERL